MFIMSVGSNLINFPKWQCTQILQQACINRNAAVAASAIALNADVNSMIDEVPLIIKAVKDSSVEIARLLVENGADVHVKDRKGRTPALLVFDYLGKYKEGLDSLFPRSNYYNSYFAFNLLSLVFNNEESMILDDHKIYPNAVSVDFANYFHDSFEEFKESEIFPRLKITEDEIDQISTAFLCDLDAYEEDDIISMIQGGELCFLDTGWSEHAIQVVFFGNYMAICNRGEGTEHCKPIMVYNIDPRSITPEKITPLLNENLSGLDAQSGIKFVYETFPQSIGGNLDDAFQRIDALQPKFQKSDNCTLASKKAAVRFAWMMLLHKRGLLIEGAADLARRESKIFTDYLADYLYREFSIYFPTGSLPASIMTSLEKKNARFEANTALFNQA